MDVEAGGTEVEVVTCQGVPTDAAAVAAAQKVATKLGSPRYIGDVAAQAVAKEGLDLGAVVLQRHTGHLVDSSAPPEGATWVRH